MSLVVQALIQEHLEFAIAVVCPCESETLVFLRGVVKGIEGDALHYVWVGVNMRT